MPADLPLLKAFFVKVLATGSLAPDQVFAGFHVEDTDGAFAVDRLAIAGVVVIFVVVRVILIVFVFGSAGDRRIGKDEGELFGEEGSLVAEVGRGFEDDDQSVCGDVSFSIMENEVGDESVQQMCLHFWPRILCAELAYKSR
jgi:hypothetical protein